MIKSAPIVRASSIVSRSPSCSRGSGVPFPLGTVSTVSHVGRATNPSRTTGGVRECLSSAATALAIDTPPKSKPGRDPKPIRTRSLSGLVSLSTRPRDTVKGRRSSDPQDPAADHPRQTRHRSRAPSGSRLTREGLQHAPRRIAPVGAEACDHVVGDRERQNHAIALRPRGAPASASLPSPRLPVPDREVALPQAPRHRSG